MPMLAKLKKLNCILSRADFVSLFLLMSFVSTAALLEIAGIFSILPFMQVVADPQAIDSNRWLSWLKSSFQFSSNKNMMIWMGVGVLGINAVTAVANVLTYWMIHKTIWGIAHRICMRLLHRYTQMPFEFFLTNNSAELVKKAISDINSLVSGVLMAGCQFVASTTKSLVILTMLFFINPKLAVLAFVIYGGAYIAMHLARHQFLERLGKEKFETTTMRYTSFNDTLAGIKSLRVSGSTPLFVSRFEKSSKRFSEIQPLFTLSNLIPRQGIEFLAFGGIVSVIMYLLLTDVDLLTVIPVLSVFAMATFKLLPALSNAFSQAASLSHNLPVIEIVYEDMREGWQLLKPAAEYAHADPMKFKEKISLDCVSYSYDSDNVQVVRDVNLEIAKSTRCALVGSTGCGKSTLIDVMVGLLFPTEGRLQVDAETVTIDNVFGWQKIIAYVPQEVFLYDDTLAVNIALGVPREEIDMELLIRSAKLAQVDAFVQSEMPAGYETVIGERGVRLSGGQRQRIGLARAFYRQPQVLFLDEATSALDNITEEAVIAAIENELPGVTVVMIAHRLTTVKFCDQIFMLDEGRIVDHGTFDQLVISNEKFRQMVEVGE